MEEAIEDGSLDQILSERAIDILKGNIKRSHPSNIVPKEGSKGSIHYLLQFAGCRINNEDGRFVRIGFE